MWGKISKWLAGSTSILFFCSFLSPISVFAADFNYLNYVDGFETSGLSINGSIGSNAITDTKYDSDGNRYVTGTLYKSGEYKVDPVALGVNINDTTAYVSKYDIAGRYQWTKYVYTPGTDIGRSYSESLATDNTGHLYWSVVYSGTVTLDGQNGSHSVSTYINMAETEQASVLIRLSADDGSLQWEAHSDTTPGGQMQYGSLTVAPDGTVYSHGRIHGSVRYDARNSASLETANGNFDSYLFRFSQTGNVQIVYSVRSFPGAYAFMQDVRVDKSGSIYIVGYYSRGIDFLKTDGSHVTYRGTGTGGYLAKIKPDGSLEWAKIATSGYFNSIALTQDDDVIVGGYHRQGAIITGFPFTLESEGINALLIEYNPDGTTAWYRTYEASGATSSGEVSGIDVDDKGTIYTTGDFDGTVRFESKEMTTVPDETYAVFVVAHRPDGTVLWSDAVHSDPMSDGRSYGLYPRGIHWIRPNLLEIFGSYDGNIVFDNKDGSTTAFTQATGSSYYSPSYFVRLQINIPPNDGTASLGTLLPVAASKSSESATSLKQGASIDTSTEDYSRNPSPTSPSLDPVRTDTAGHALSTQSFRSSSSEPHFLVPMPLAMTTLGVGGIGTLFMLYNRKHKKDKR